MRRSRLCQRGFTLLEVLISILVLVMAIATILPLFAVGLTSHKRGVDQAHLAWIAPRIAARIQEQFYSTQPRTEIQGYVRETADGALLIDDVAQRIQGRDGASYTFRATLTPLAYGNQVDVAANTAYHLVVRVGYLDSGEDQEEVYHTVLLRRLAR